MAFHYQFQTIEDLVKSLELESKVAIDWFSMNNTIVNPDKFKTMITDKRKRDHYYGD